MISDLTWLDEELVLDEGGGKFKKILHISENPGMHVTKYYEDGIDINRECEIRLRGYDFSEVGDTVTLLDETTGKHELFTIIRKNFKSFTTFFQLSRDDNDE